MHPNSTILIPKKLDFAINMGIVGITWWVSSVVFCGSIFAGVWLQRAELTANPTALFWLGVGVMAFLASVVAFGLFLFWVARRLARETRDLLDSNDFGKTV